MIRNRAICSTNRQAVTIAIERREMTKTPSAAVGAGAGQQTSALAAKPAHLGMALVRIRS